MVLYAPLIDNVVKADWVAGELLTEGDPSNVTECEGIGFSGDWRRMIGPARASSTYPSQSIDEADFRKPFISFTTLLGF